MHIKVIDSNKHVVQSLVVRQLYKRGGGRARGGDAHNLKRE